MEKTEEIENDSSEFDEKLRLKWGYSSPYFEPESLEEAFADDQFETFYLAIARRMITSGIFFTAFYTLMDYRKLHKKTIFPSACMALNMLNTIFCRIMISYRPRLARYLVQNIVLGIWVTSCGFASRYKAFEASFTVHSLFHLFVDHTTSLANAASCFAVFFKIFIEIFQKKPHIGVKSVVLILDMLWSWILSYEGNLVSRRRFLASKRKETMKNELNSKKNARLMFYLVEEKSTGNWRMVKKDILTNELIDKSESDYSFDGQSISTEPSMLSSISTDSSNLLNDSFDERDQDRWFKDSLPTLRRMITYMVSVHFILSLFNWTVLPAEAKEARSFLFNYHLYFLLPLSVNILFLMRFFLLTNYRRYNGFMNLLLGIFVVTSWFETFTLNRYDVDGQITETLIYKIFLLFLLRHNFIFETRRQRILTASADFVMFIIMVFVGNFWKNEFTPHQVSYIPLLVYLSDGANFGMWKASMEVYRYLRQVDLMIEEIKRENIERENILKRYTAEDEKVSGEVVRRRVEAPERWTRQKIVSTVEDNSMEFLEIVTQLDLVENLSLDADKLRALSHRILEAYKENPYHNISHALSVCRTMSYFLQVKEISNYYSDREKFNLLLSSLAHDVGHPGKNNAFLIKSESPLVKEFGSKSTLERYHANLLLSLIEEVGLEGLFEEKEFKSDKEFMKKIILCTDVATYGDTLQSFKKYKNEIMSDSESSKSKLPRALLGAMLLICSDVGNVAYDTPHSELWLVNLLNEFYIQGDYEKNLGRTASLFMDRKRNAPYTLCCGFVDAVAGKMIKELASLVDIEDFLNQMENNRVIFGKKKTAELTPAM